MPLSMYEEIPPKESPFSSIRYVLAIAAGKGGVGKSTVTVQLAFALKALGFKVGILDADLYGPSIQQMIKLEEMPQQKGDRIFPAKGGGISYFSISFFQKEEEAMLIRAPLANSLLSQFSEEVHWGNLDFLLVDFPPGTGDIPLSLVKNIPFKGAFLVTTPQKVSEIDVKKASVLFKEFHIPLLGIIENMSYYTPLEADRLYPFGKGAAERLQSYLNLDVCVQIPLDPDLNALQEEGKNLFSNKEEFPSKRCFQELATLLQRILT